MSEEKHQIYAQVYREKVQAIAAARGLFAEVYELLRAEGHEVELRPFEAKPDEVPQIHRLDGLELHDGSFRPLINFSVDSVSTYNFSQNHYVEVKFEPGYSYKKLPGFDQLVTVTRNPKRTPNAMNPKSICEFVLKYARAVHKRDEANLERRAREILKQGRVKSNEERAKELRERANKGRAYVYHSQDGHEDELIVTFRGTAEETRQALALLDQAFPLPQTTSRE
jgi:hypothetical protein